MGQDSDTAQHSRAPGQSPFCRAVSSQLSQFGCFSTKQLAGKHTPSRGKSLCLENSLSQSNPGGVRGKDRDNTLQCLEKPRLSRQFRAEHGQILLWLGRDLPHRGGFVHAFGGKCDIPEYADTRGVNTYASSGTEVLQGPWNRLLPTCRYTAS